MEGKVISIRYDKHSGEYTIRRRTETGKTTVAAGNSLRPDEIEFAESAAHRRDDGREVIWCN